MNQCPLGPWVSHEDRLDFFRKFAEIIASECLSAVSTTPAINSSTVSMTLLTNLSVVTRTPKINLCHGFSVIGGVVDTGDKFITGVIDTAEQLSPVTTTPGINLSPVSTTPVNNYCRWQWHPCQCTSCNGPGFDPSIHWHSGIWEAADEAVLNLVRNYL